MHFPAHVGSNHSGALCSCFSKFAMEVMIESDKILMPGNELEEAMIPEPICKPAEKLIERVSIGLKKNIVLRDTDRDSWARFFHRLVCGTMRGSDLRYDAQIPDRIFEKRLP